MREAAARDVMTWRAGCYDAFQRYLVDKDTGDILVKKEMDRPRGLADGIDRKPRGGGAGLVREVIVFWRESGSCADG